MTADDVWKITVGIMKKEKDIKGGGSFSFVSRVETAYAGYRADSPDTRMRLCSRILEAYGAVYDIPKDDEYNSMASTLALIAAKKASGNQLDNMINDYDPEKSKDRSFLLYFHDCLRNEFKRSAEEERSKPKSPPFGVSKVSRNKFRTARKYTITEFGCEPQECTSEQLKKLLEYINGVKNLSKTTETELKQIIEENTVRSIPSALGDDDLDTVGNIPDGEKSIPEMFDEDEPDEIKTTDRQMYYFGINTAYRFLGDYVDRYLTKKGEKTQKNIGELLYAENDELKKQFQRFVFSGLEQFCKGADAVCKIAAEDMKNGRNFPTMLRIAETLGLSNESISHAFKKVADKLLDVFTYKDLS